ncbi:MAG: hypothetical protein M3Y51_04905 [Actinomycetota bacterium]|nr:hypothetical protein [Actinomycetota bacterium]
MFILSTIVAVGLVLVGAVQAAATEIELGRMLVTTVLGLVIPLIVGLATKLGAKPAVKQLVTLVLAAVGGFLVEASTGDGSAVFTLEALGYAALTWLQSIAFYLGVLAPLDYNAKAAPNRGLGTVVDTHSVERIQ